MALDTLSISKELRAAGFSEEQADVLATQIAAQPDDLATRQDIDVMKHELVLALADVDHKLTTEIERLDHKIDQVASQLLLKLGAGMVVGFGLAITAVSIAVAVLINQLG